MHRSKKLLFQKIRQDQLISNGRVNKNYTAPDCGLAPNCTVERRGDINSKLTCQFNYPGAIGQVGIWNQHLVIFGYLSIKRCYQ